MDGDTILASPADLAGAATAASRLTELAMPPLTVKTAPAPAQPPMHFRKPLLSCAMGRSWFGWRIDISGKVGL